MSKLLDKFNKDQQKNMPEIQTGDVVKVHQKIKEKDKERIQIFEGVVIAKKHGRGIPATVTVRKVVDGIGVERIFPIHSPSLEKIEVVTRARTKRSKLYYLRTAKGKKAKLKNKEFSAAIADDEPVEEPVEEVISEEPANKTSTKTEPAQMEETPEKEEIK